MGLATSLVLITFVPDINSRKDHTAVDLEGRTRRGSMGDVSLRVGNFQTSVVEGKELGAPTVLRNRSTEEVRQQCTGYYFARTRTGKTQTP